MHEPQIPAGTKPGRKTPVFSAETMPPALGRDHVTTVWAELVVLCGSVRFFDETGRTHTATSAHPVAIIPNTKHRIEPSSDAEFYVQFYLESDN